MPVLIIVLSAYLFFFAVIALIAIAEYADRRERRQIAERGSTPVVSLGGMSAAQASDPYSGFWQAQVPGLRLIHDAGHSGTHIRNLRSCFVAVCRRFPEIYDGHTLEQWVRFLQQEQLVVCGGEKVRITPQGSDFLRIQITRSATVHH
jgi:hypothetical protein